MIIERFEKDGFETFVCECNDCKREFTTHSPHQSDWCNPCINKNMIPMTRERKEQFLNEYGVWLAY